MQPNTNHHIIPKASHPGKPAVSRMFNREALYMQVHAAIKERIDSGQWPPGTSVPNESDLAREFGVSAGTMRKALDLLEFERILVRKQGRGTFVLDLDADDMDRIASCYWKVGQIAKDARFEGMLAEAQPTEPSALFRHRLAQALFKAKADFTEEAPNSSIPTAKRALLLVAHEELIAAYLKKFPDTPVKDAHAKTKDQVRNHLLGREVEVKEQAAA